MVGTNGASDARRLRVAMIGAGAISKFHLTAWRSIDRVDLLAVCDVDRTRAERRAAEFGIPAVYTDVGDLLDREKPDAIDIATPLETHLPMLRAAAARGVACLCQKPLAPSLADAERLVGEIAPKIPLMVNENRRHLPQFRLARQWLAEGLVGEIQQVSATVFRSQLLTAADGGYAGTAKTPETLSDPRLFINRALIHQIDALRSLLGPLEVIAARKRHAHPEFAGDVLATLLMETPDGVPVVLSGNNVAVGYPVTFNDRIEIMGSRASLMVTLDAVRLLGPEPREVRYDLAKDYGAIYQSCFTTAAEAFRDGVLDGAPFATDGHDNIETIRIAEDAYRLSAFSGLMESSNR